MKKITGFRLKSLAEGTFVFVMAIMLTLVFVKLVGFFLTPSKADTSPAGLSESLVGAVVAAVSTGFVVYQLQSGEKSSKHQVEVEKSEFILEYNRSFIENEEMTKMERYLECRLTHVEPDEIKNLERNRQTMVNYLVYLEGFSSCVLSDVLSFQDIDDLFAYRFFLALNHVEVQAMDLLPYAEFYRGCYKLYDKWLDYRIKSPDHSEEDDWELPLFSSALCNHYEYETYACPEMHVVKNVGKDNKLITLTARLPMNRWYLPFASYWVKITFENGSNHVTVKSGTNTKKRQNYCIFLKLLRRLLKELIYEYYFHSVDEIDTADNDPDVENLFKAIKGTRETLYRDCYKDKLELRCLDSENNLNQNELKQIANLLHRASSKANQPLRSILEDKPLTIAVFPSIFKLEKDHLFNAKNVYVCVAHERILGIAINGADQLDWSPDILMQEIAKLVNKKGKYRKSKIEINEEIKNMVAFNTPVSAFATESSIVISADPPIGDLIIENYIISKLPEIQAKQ